MPWQLHCGDMCKTVIWLHDDVIKWTRFLRNWPFVRGTHRSPGKPVTGGFASQKTRNTGYDVFFDVRLNERMNKQWSHRWFETPGRSMWRHCNGIGQCNVSPTLQFISGTIAGECGAFTSDPPGQRFEGPCHPMSGCYTTCPRHFGDRVQHWSQCHASWLHMDRWTWLLVWTAGGFTSFPQSHLW